MTNIYRAWTDGMIPVPSTTPVDPNAFAIRSLANKRLARLARQGVNFTQEITDKVFAQARAEIEARDSLVDDPNRVGSRHHY